MAKRCPDRPHALAISKAAGPAERPGRLLSLGLAVLGAVRLALVCLGLTAGVMLGHALVWRALHRPHTSASLAMLRPAGQAPLAEATRPGFLLASQQRSARLFAAAAGQPFTY
ncbi:MAG: hypothetical protein AB1505_18170 [Candidatus Latescibacterota bacterium]